MHNKSYFELSKNSLKLTKDLLTRQYDLNDIFFIFPVKIRVRANFDLWLLANHIPSPSSHACIVAGCQKIYTRPAHLRAHLKSHDRDSHIKCAYCCVTVQSSDVLSRHMLSHKDQMKEKVKKI